MQCLQCQRITSPTRSSARNAARRWRLVPRCASPLRRTPASVGSAREPTGARRRGLRLARRSLHPALGDRMLSMRESLEGERKQVTVLFADRKSLSSSPTGSGGSAADSRPDPRVLMEAVNHYEGTVNQVLGDGIMALFGRRCPRGSRAPRLLRGAAHAGIRAALRGRVAGMAVRCGSGSDQLGGSWWCIAAICAWILRGRQTRTWQRGWSSSHRRAASCHPRDAAARAGPGIVQPTGPLGQGPRRPARGLRADRARPGRSRLQAAAMRGHPLRRARDRARHASPHDERAGRSRADRLRIGEPGSGSRAWSTRSFTLTAAPVAVIEAATCPTAGDALPPIVALLRDYFQIEEVTTTSSARQVGSRIRGSTTRWPPVSRWCSRSGRPGPETPGTPSIRPAAATHPGVPERSSCGRARPSPSASCWRTCTGSIRSRSPCWTG